MDTDSPAISPVASNDNSSSAGEGNRIDVPLENDVLCGRGGSINSHKGNEQFRNLVEKRKRVYLTARFKREKRLIASSIVTEIRGMNPSGRFLARKGDKDSGYWYDIGDEKARDKTSQALRENAPSIRAEIETEINQQREEMRKQEESTSQQQSAQAKPHAAVPYPLQLHGLHGAPVPPPPPPPPHGQPPHSYASYAQQYYDYYYHYYGYGAPPPPPPPGYPGGTHPPAGYPHPPIPPYWSAQPAQHPPEQPKGEEELKEANPSTAAPAPGVPPSAVVTASSSFPYLPQPSPLNQEEEDRRIAMALQQEENARAFEDRNKRYGSDRKASRSTAFCAPGYRPRLLNDRALDDYTHAPGTPSRKRPAMSASHLVSGGKTSRTKSASLSNVTMQDSPMAASSSVSAHSLAPEQLTQEEIDRRMAMSLQAQEDKAFHNHVVAAENSTRKCSRSNAHPKFERTSGPSFGFDSMMSSSLMSWSRRAQIAPAPEGDNVKRHDMNNNTSMNRSELDVNMDMDQKPAASNSPFSKLLPEDFDHQHNHDHSLGSLHSISSKGRGVHFKEESDMLSLFGEGSTIIPLLHSHGSQRVRDASINSYTPIALDESQKSASSRMSQFQRKGAPAPQHSITPQKVGAHEQHDSSLLSQVAHHILGTFGPSWAESSTTTPNRDSSKNSNNHQSLQRSYQTVKSSHHQHQLDEMETEMGQEVVMDVRDESHMPPPQTRGASVQVDWPSRAGCHSWIPETIGASASAFFGTLNKEHENRLSHDLDHSLLRDNSYGRADISPVHSLDMDSSHSSLGGTRRRSKGTASLMNLFDQKNVENVTEELHSMNHTALQQVPSWERSYRSRSPAFSLGDMVGDEEDDSLIRVNSYDVKESLSHQNSHSSAQMMPPPPPIMHHHHVTPQQHNKHQPLDESDDIDMGMEWEGHAGE
ncbi:hypothetical protein IV203_016463 [Nitzschia inconspicua]|uniref:DUF6824 domain-containing protein n=1 Tax=Nitzschia inconspicua TaxID=303405 RepID=A0A9K3PHQ2_9STRA|nr:hypothetical protein IV203_016463 [Nitzschia inconspicua]